ETRTTVSVDQSALRIIPVHHPALQRRPIEQTALRRRVALHRRVVVEVIASEVREDREVVCDIVDATLFERVRARLHPDPFSARGEEIGESPLHCYGIFSGQFRTARSPSETPTQRAPGTRGPTRFAEQRRGELCD